MSPKNFPIVFIHEGIEDVLGTSLESSVEIFLINC